MAHIELAYQQASALALAVALFISLACATIVTWLVSRRLSAPLRELTDAARELSRGHYSRRVPPMAVMELDTLAKAFNSAFSDGGGHGSVFEIVLPESTNLPDPGRFVTGE